MVRPLPFKVTKPISALAIPDSGVANTYVKPGWAYRSATTLIVTQHRLYYTPIYVEYVSSFTRISVQIGVAGLAGTVARLGIYNATRAADGRLTPGTLLLDAGTVSVASTGGKEITISQVLLPGWYFLAFSTDGSGVRCDSVPTSTANVVSPVTGQDATLDTHHGGIVPYVLLADGAAALANPATAPTAAENSEGAVVNLRY